MKSNTVKLAWIGAAALAVSGCSIPVFESPEPEPVQARAPVAVAPAPAPAPAAAKPKKPAYQPGEGLRMGGGDEDGGWG